MGAYASAEAASLRGGAWMNTETLLRVTKVAGPGPSNTEGNGNVGFRLAGAVVSEGTTQVTGVEKTATQMTVQFQGDVGRIDWRVMASADLVAFEIDVTANAAISEVATGCYEAIVTIVGSPANDFLRIERRGRLRVQFTDWAPERPHPFDDRRSSGHAPSQVPAILVSANSCGLG